MKKLLLITATASLLFASTANAHGTSGRVYYIDDHHDHGQSRIYVDRSRSYYNSYESRKIRRYLRNNNRRSFGRSCRDRSHSHRYDRYGNQYHY